MLGFGCDQYYPGAGWARALGLVLLVGLGAACARGHVDAPGSATEEPEMPAPTGGRAGSAEPEPGSARPGGQGAPAMSLDAAVEDAPQQPENADGPPAAAGPSDGATQTVTGDLALGSPCPGPSDDRGGCAEGLVCCQPCCDGRPAVCTRPVENAAGIGVGHCPLPDLAVDLEKLESHVGVGPMTFSDKSCAVGEKCVAAGGTRNTLHFEVNTPNLGTGDLSLGRAGRIPGFEYAACHDHFHFGGYALYQLLDGNGVEVLQGTKRAFCLRDDEPVDGYPLDRPEDDRYDCDRQGIQRGWADSYYNGLECQYIDVTAVAPGRYTLRVTVNPERVFPELRYDNNVAEVQVDIGAPGDLTDPCGGEVAGTKRECGWSKAMTATCTPGQEVRVGCGSDCGLGARTGDPMMRVCPGDGPCSSPGLGSNDDCRRRANGARVDFDCPESGTYTVYVGPAKSNAQATCTVAVAEP